MECLEMQICIVSVHTGSHVDFPTLVSFLLTEIGKKPTKV
jgi:hypothetical protein